MTELETVEASAECYRIAKNLLHVEEIALAAMTDGAAQMMQESRIVALEKVVDTLGEMMLLRHKP